MRGRVFCPILSRDILSPPVLSLFQTEDNRLCPFFLQVLEFETCGFLFIGAAELDDFDNVCVCQCLYCGGLPVVVCSKPAVSVT